MLVVIVNLFTTSALDYYAKGTKYYEEGQILLAEQNLKKAIEKDPTLAEAYLNLGGVYVKNGWYDGAEEKIYKGVALLEQRRSTPLSGVTWEQLASLGHTNLGFIELKRIPSAELKGDHDLSKDLLTRAISHFEKAIQLEPSNSKAQAALKQCEDIKSYVKEQEEK